MIDISATMERLARRRSIFHSEADFQHELAWLIREENPKLGIRLEYPAQGIGALDIVICKRGRATFAIELKYFKERLDIRANHENFTLRGRKANPRNSYDACKDLQRAEQFVQTHPSTSAAVVVLTNDAKYWNGPTSQDRVGSEFAIADARTLRGTLNWNANAKGAKKGKESPVTLQNSYRLTWQDYSQFDMPNGLFRFLHIAVPSSARKRSAVRPLPLTPSRKGRGE